MEPGSSKGKVPEVLMNKRRTLPHMGFMNIVSQRVGSFIIGTQKGTPNFGIPLIPYLESEDPE